MWVFQGYRVLDSLVDVKRVCSVHLKPVCTMGPPSGFCHCLVPVHVSTVSCCARATCRRFLYACGLQEIFLIFKMG